MKTQRAKFVDYVRSLCVRYQRSTGLVVHHYPRKKQLVFNGFDYRDEREGCQKMLDKLCGVAAVQS